MRFFGLHLSRHRASLLLATLPLLLVLRVMVHAQGGVGSTRGLPDSAGGVHTIQGHVYYPSGRRAGSGILVKLEGNVNGSRSTSTDGDGSFLFTSLPAAQYTVVMDAGPDYEPIQEAVTIYGNTGGSGLRTGQTLVLDIHLLLKGIAATEEKVFAGIPRDAVASYKKGMRFAQSGDSNKAIEQLKRALSIHPGFAPALNQLGVQYLKLGQADKAEEVLEAAVKSAPNDYEPRLNYGIALLGGKKFHEAESQLREALGRNNTSPSGHLYLGIALISLHNYVEAEKELLRAIDLGGDRMSLAHYYLGGIYWHNKEQARAADELELYLKLTPHASDAARTRATIKQLRGQE